MGHGSIINCTRCIAKVGNLLQNTETEPISKYPKRNITLSRGDIKKQDKTYRFLVRLGTIQLQTD